MKHCKFSQATSVRSSVLIMKQVVYTVVDHKKKKFYPPWVELEFVLKGNCNWKFSFDDLNLVELEYTGY